MKRLADLKVSVRCLAVLAALVIGLGGQVATATEGGGDGGGGKEGSKGGQSRDQGIYYESGEADAPPAGFTNLTRALSAFQGYSLFLSPEEATARLLLDLTYGPLIELLTALSFQQQFGAPRDAQAAPQESKKTASGTSGFVQLGKGLSIVERIQLSEKLSGVLGRKDALVTEEEGGLPYWIFEEDCGESSKAAGASEPAPPTIIWEPEMPAKSPAQGATKAKSTDGDKSKPGAGKAGAGDCKEDSIRNMERRALDFLDGEYLWLQEEFGAKDKKARERKLRVVEDKMREEEIKKKRRRSQ